MVALVTPLTLIAVLICPLMMAFCLYHVVHMLRGGMGHKGHAAPARDGMPATEARLRELGWEVATLRRQAGVAAVKLLASTANGAGSHAGHGS
jgi:hypothetical protein